MNDIGGLVDSFTNQLVSLIEQQTMERARLAVGAAFGRPGPERPSSALMLKGPAKVRKKAPLQLCPVPGCHNPAAPVFGMVCAAHKGVPKAKIKKYREARRAAKGKAPAKPARAKGKRRTKTAARKRRAPTTRPAPRKKLTRAKPSRKRAPKPTRPAAPSPAQAAAA